MTQTQKFTPSELKVIEQLIQGKSNKQIALALGITERTVEDHLHHIYTKLEVVSRAEAIVKLVPAASEPVGGKNQSGESTAPEKNDPAVESTVVESKQPEYKDIVEQAMPKRKNRKSFSWMIWVAALVLVGITASVILYMQNSKDSTWRYEREAEFPDELTVGQDLDRSNASGTKVHGQFGSESFGPWDPKSGFVRYFNIEIPKNSELYLQIRYSKFSKSSVPVLIYLDDEKNPRASFYPTDQGDWNKFMWTEWISLREVTKGIHSIKFFTNGQEFGVADLDQFVLTTEPPN